MVSLEIFSFACRPNFSPNLLSYYSIVEGSRQCIKINNVTRSRWHLEITVYYIRIVHRNYWLLLATKESIVSNSNFSGPLWINTETKPIRLRFTKHLHKMNPCCHPSILNTLRVLPRSGIIRLRSLWNEDLAKVFVIEK